MILYSSSSNGAASGDTWHSGSGGGVVGIGTAHRKEITESSIASIAACGQLPFFHGPLP